MANVRVVTMEVEHYVQAAPPELQDAEKHARGYLAFGPAWTAFHDEQILACAGVMLPWDHVAEGWALITPYGRRYPQTICRHVVRGLRHVIREYGLRRLTADVPEPYLIGHRWITWMGFEREAAMRLYGPSGETFIRYALFPKETT